MWIFVQISNYKISVIQFRSLAYKCLVVMSAAKIIIRECGVLSGHAAVYLYLDQIVFQSFIIHSESETNPKNLMFHHKFGWQIDLQNSFISRLMRKHVLYSNKDYTTSPELRRYTTLWNMKIHNSKFKFNFDSVRNKPMPYSNFIILYCQLYEKIFICFTSATSPKNT